jgi:anti-anti-sigma factor
MPSAAMFEIEREGETIIFTPAVNLSAFEDVESNAGGVVEALSDLSIKNLVMDFQKSDYFGSSALALFVKLWKTIKGRNGCMAFCNLSENELEVLHVTRLDKLWTICESREQAMKAVRE